MESGWRKNYVRYTSYFLNVALHYRERADARAYLEILLSLITIVTFSILALRPTLLTIAQLLKDIQSKEATITQMNDKIAKVSQAQTLYDQQYSNIQYLDTALPKNPQPDAFVRHVEGLSGKHSLTVTNVSVGKAVLSGADTPTSSTKKTDSAFPNGIGSTIFSVAGSTNVESYGVVASFYRDFIAQRRPLQIDSLAINVNEKGTEGRRLIITMSGRIPYLLSVPLSTQTASTTIQEEPL